MKSWKIADIEKLLEKKRKRGKELSPFIIGTSNGDLLVYNNWNRKLKNIQWSI